MGRIKMKRIKFIYWQDNDWWLGYLEEYPEYLTQGRTFDELKENLKDLYNDLESGEIPYFKKVAELEIA